MKKKIVYKEISVNKPFHSPLFNSIHESFSESIKQIVYQPPSIPYFSNLTGDYINYDNLTNTYWADHLCNPVRFYESIQKLKDSNYLFLEIGSTNSLTSLVKKTLPQVSCLQSLSRCILENSYGSLLHAVGKVWSQGINVDWPKFNEDRINYKIPLPTYPYLRERYWLEPPAKNKKQITLSAYIYEPNWLQEEIDECLLEEKNLLAILLFHDSSSKSKLISEILEESGHFLIHVYPGIHFNQVSDQEYHINCLEEENCIQLLTQINKKIDRILFCLPLSNQNELIEGITKDFFCVFNLVRSLSKVMRQEKIFFCLLTQKMWRINHQDKIDPFKSLLLGISKTVYHELSNVIMKVIDVDKIDSIIIRKIKKELFLVCNANVGYRQHTRFKLSYKQVLLDDTTKPDLLLKEKVLILSQEA